MSRTYFRERRLIVDLFVIALGISCWVSINGLWMQTPILTTQLPEKWNLASYIVIITQMANIGPIAFGLFRKKLKSYEGIVIHLTLAIGVFSSILLAKFWKNTVVIGTKEHSLPFLVLTGFLALVDCTSSVLYLPYMANFKSKYLMSFFVGEGLSGLIPSIVSLFQGVGGNPTCETTTINGTIHQHAVYPEPKFSVTIFCVFLTIIMIFSWVSFTILNSSFCHSELSREKPMNKEGDDNELPIMGTREAFKLTRNRIRYLLFLQALISALTNGVLPSLQSYSCAPYGTLAYNLAVKLAGLANPICAFLAFFWKSKINLKMITLLTCLGLCFSSYTAVTAVLSPSPPFVSSPFGSFLLIISWISLTGTFSYTKSCIASVFRDFSKRGQLALFWVGVFTQTGSAIGAILTFTLLNYTHIFKSYNPCS
ncbi:solute carrier family 52, riboflavin transporter, member 3-A [Tetranychus urticae]|uniref:Riboflavin transporter n=1 Tax=Tetranychus urticae TaxID=32264 RepID=T1KV18_TETUR|nr:solute carrier family 52, riboflavin transporter, member 3-A [Tetranychus urticae]